MVERNVKSSVEMRIAPLAYKCFNGSCIPGVERKKGEKNLIAKLSDTLGLWLLGRKATAAFSKMLTVILDSSSSSFIS